SIRRLERQSKCKRMLHNLVQSSVSMSGFLREIAGRVSDVLPSQYRTKLASILPLNYDTATLKTIENIDVIWLERRSIAQAFEVEHTTAIYSGLLRMADLLVLQPRIQISLHIVAPSSRREQVRKAEPWQNVALSFPTTHWRLSLSNLI